MLRHKPFPRQGWRTVMRQPGLAVLAGVVACAGGLAAGPAAQAAAGPAQDAAGPARAAAGTSAALFGVSTVSATNAWAIGDSISSTRTTQPLALRWNGKIWTKVATPSLFSFSWVTAVSADSAKDAWAVGHYSADPTCSLSCSARSFVLHWKGTRWITAASPSPGGTGPNSRTDLFGVTALSATDAWAAGAYSKDCTWDSCATSSLLLHWNGTRWKQVPSANPGGLVFPLAVAAGSRTDAWAVGYYSATNSTPNQSLILHWNGTSWAQVPSPSPGGINSTVLTGVSVVSATDAWAAGYYQINNGAYLSLTLHWNGKSWKRVASPNPAGTRHGDGNFLSGVSADSATDAWAVGYYQINGGAYSSLILHWNGKSWKPVPSHTPGGSLSGVDAMSAAHAWAVGGDVTGAGTGQPVTLRWNGTRWTRISSPG